MCLSILDRLPESIEEAERQDRSVVRQIEQEQKEEFFALPLELLTNIKDTIEGEFAGLRR